MRLSTLVQGLSFVLIKGSLDIEISSINYDSRKAEANSIFVAIPGFIVDGHEFIADAIKMGARVIIAEREISVDNNVTVLQVTDARKALAIISANYFDNPSDKLNLIGVTGTNGKTSTTFFINSIFEQANRKIGLIGTIGSKIGEKVVPTKNTTPESLHLQELLAEMVADNIDSCAMEVSSHALSLDRVSHCNFNSAIFTNLSPDHLELHHSMEEYFDAKSQLFNLTTQHNIVNIDDEYGLKLIDKIKDYDTELITFGINNTADVYASNINYFAEYSTYIVHTPKGSMEIKVNIPGVIYVYNSLAAIACAYCNNISLEDIRIGVNNLQGIKGRLEMVYRDNDYKILIDFAHTEDGLKKALNAIKSFVTGKIILVFGVYAPAGSKGSSKRKAMGKVAAKYADFSIVTSDNPKNQDPKKILNEVVAAIEGENGSCIGIVNREEAIKYAIQHCEKGDVILIAGKGHETAQIIGDKEIPFNEAEIILETVKDLKQLKIS